SRAAQCFFKHPGVRRKPIEHGAVTRFNAAKSPKRLIINGVVVRVLAQGLRKKLGGEGGLVLFALHESLLALTRLWFQEDFNGGNVRHHGTLFCASGGMQGKVRYDVLEDL